MKFSIALLSMLSVCRRSSLAFVGRSCRLHPAPTSSMMTLRGGSSDAAVAEMSTEATETPASATALYKELVEKLEKITHLGKHKIMQATGTRSGDIAKSQL